MLLAWVLTAGAAELAAQDASAGPSFLIFRYASESALAMYSGYDAGPMLLVVGMLHNPRSEYQEVMGGVARAVGVPGGSFTVAAAGASTNTGWYAQLYALPAVQAGPARLEATIQFAEPLELVAGVRNARDEARLTLRSSF